MYYHLILTDECNLSCSYCRGKDYFSSECGHESPGEYPRLPAVPDYDVEVLEKFLENDPDPAVLFYGGEPMLEAGRIMGFMDRMDSCRFSVYTNGLLVRNLPPEYVRRFDTMIISIDGDMSTTDGYRGEGVYDGVIGAVEYIRDSGFSGEIIGRMTVAENTDIYNSVTYLSGLEGRPFDSVHWQMDAAFWYDYSTRPEFAKWMNDSYNPGICRLVRRWLDIMRETGEVFRWYPFCGLVEDILNGVMSSPMRCGAGHMNYAIQTDGNIVPCPCMSGMKEYYCGNIRESSPGSLKKFAAGGSCTGCDILDFCGGRCLYSNILSPWPEEGRVLVYNSVKNLKSAVRSVLPGISALIEEGIISVDDFHINKYNGCEIIP